MTDPEYFKALTNLIIGSDEEKAAARKYLEESDPAIWKE